MGRCAILLIKVTGFCQNQSDSRKGHWYRIYCDEGADVSVHKYSPSIKSCTCTRSVFYGCKCLLNLYPKLAGVFIPILSDILMTRSGQRYVKKLRRSAQDINEIVTVKTLEAHLLKYARQKLGNIFFAIITLTLSPSK